MESFGRTIWKARRSKGLSQRELAAKLGLDYIYLSKLENDTIAPFLKVIKGLALELELNEEELEAIVRVKVAKTETIGMFPIRLMRSRSLREAPFKGELNARRK